MSEDTVQILADSIQSDEEEFELVSSVRQLDDGPALRREAVTLTDWKTKSGKPARFLTWELSAADWAEFMESGRIYKNGVLQRYDNKDEDIRFLAYTLRDAHGNRLWPTIEAAQRQLGELGRATLLALINAANRVNSAKSASAEGNSDATPTAS